MCNFCEWHTLDGETTPPTHFADSIDNLVHHVIVLTVQSTHGLGSRTSDVEDAGGQVFVADADLVGVGHGWFP